MGFLLSRRWVLFALAVLVLAYGCWWLGEWQFDRREQRSESNAVVRTNLRAQTVPVGEVMAVGEPVAPGELWRHVEATGRYQPDESVVIRYQTREGVAGVDIVTPLRTTDGAVLLVDRGWMPTGNRGLDSIDAPAPPGGEVTVTGWVRADATGDSARVGNASARAVSSAEIGPTLGEPVYAGFLDLERERPAPATPLERAEPPDLGGGPHFFYGLQWWFFGLLAIFGFGYLAYDERRKLAETGDAGPDGRPPPADDDRRAVQPVRRG